MKHFVFGLLTLSVDKVIMGEGICKMPFLGHFEGTLHKLEVNIL